MHAEVLPCTICLPLVLIVQAVFHLERGQTDKHKDRQTNGETRMNALPHAGGYTAGVGNNNMADKQRSDAQVHIDVSFSNTSNAGGNCIKNYLALT